MQSDEDIEAKRAESLSILQGYYNQYSSIEDNANSAKSHLCMVNESNKENLSPRNREFVDMAIADLDKVIKSSKAGSTDVEAHYKEIEEFQNEPTDDGASPKSEPRRKVEIRYLPPENAKSKEKWTTDFIDLSENIHEIVRYVREKNAEGYLAQENVKEIEVKIRGIYRKSNEIVNDFFNIRDISALKIYKLWLELTHLLEEAHSIEDEQKNLIQEQQEAFRLNKPYKRARSN